MDTKLQIPLPVDLTSERGWAQPGKYLYFVARYHLCIKEEQTDELGFGEILRTFRPADFPETEVTIAFEEECTIADVKETMSAVLLGGELRQMVNGLMADNAKKPSYQVSANIKPLLEENIRSRLEQSIKAEHSISTQVRKSFKISQKINSDSQELRVAAAGYRKHTQKIFLHYIDYLTVEYKPTALGLRKKKRNLPSPLGGKHVNKILINMPLFKLNYWKLLPESFLLFTETEYKQLQKVEDTQRITFEELNEEIRLPLPSKPDQPTLYTLSNIAFPLRWIDRKGPWTREELVKTELDEAKGSAWWFQSGSESRGIGRDTSKRAALKGDALPAVSGPYNEDIVAFYEISLDLDVDDLTSSFINSFRVDLAEALEIPLSDIVILGVKPGSVQLLVAITRFVATFPDTIQEMLSGYKFKFFAPWRKLPDILTFISYAHEDKLLVQGVYYFLKLEKLEPWMDVHELLGGQDWNYNIFKALQSSTGFVFCLSKNSIEGLKKKTTLFKELGKAKDMVLQDGPEGMFLVPLRLDNCEYPEDIGKYQTLDWDEDKDELVVALQEGLKKRRRITH